MYFERVKFTICNRVNDASRMANGKHSLAVHHKVDNT